MDAGMARLYVQEVLEAFGPEFVMREVQEWQAARVQADHAAARKLMGGKWIVKSGS
jgi:hypothetical protein